MSLEEPTERLSIWDEYPYLDNVTADFRNGGFPTNINPFPQASSAPRLNMQASHSAQAIIIDGCEHPHVFVGTEHNLGEYELNGTKRDNPIEVLDVIYRYSGMRFGPHGQFPQATIIYRDLTTKEISFFHLNRFTRGADDFGFLNKWENFNQLKAGAIITPETVLSTSPAHIGPAYCLGTNLSTAYITFPDVIEDAMLISESAAKKMTSSQVSRVVINGKPDMRFLNLYGDEDDYRIIPNIGDVVREDGLLCGMRPTDSKTFAADVDPKSLREVRDMQDTLYTIKPGSIVADIEVFINQNQTKHPYLQIDQYQDGAIAYWRAIWQAYVRLVKNVPIKPKISKTFNTLIDTAILRLVAMKASPIPKMAKAKPDLEGLNGQPVDYIQIVITYIAKRKVQKGFKLSNRYGGMPMV